MTHLVFSSFHDFPLNARPFILDQEPDGFDFDEKGGSNHLAFWFDDYEYSAEDVAVFLQSAVGEFGLSVLSPIVEALRAPEEPDGDKIEEALASDDFWKHLQSLIGLAGFYTYQSYTRFIIFETAAFERQGLGDEIDNWREYPLTLAVVDREGGVVGRVDTLKFFEAQKAQAQSNLAHPLITNDMNNEVVHLPAITFERLKAVLFETLERESANFDEQYDWEELAKNQFNDIPSFMASGWGVAETNVQQWIELQQQAPSVFDGFVEKYVDAHQIADAFQAAIEIAGIKPSEPAYCVYEVDENEAVVTVIVQGADEEATEPKLTEIVEHWEGYTDHRFIGAIDANAAAQLKRIGLSHIYE